MGEEGRGKFDHVAHFEPVFSEQFSGQFHAGNVPKISVDAGAVHQPNGWFINDWLQPSSDAALNAVCGAGQEDNPLSAVARPHDFVLVKNVLSDVLRVES